MNRALYFLWFAMLKRRILRFLRSLHRPTTLIGFLAVTALVFFLFCFRRHEVVGHLVDRRALVGGALIMLCGSLFNGFLQRGLVFELPDVEFIFTSPFTQRQIILYRLLSSYLFAFVQSLFFFAIFCTHLRQPILVSGCVFLLQLACFHISAAAAIYAGTISEEVHYRLRWMMMGAFFFLTALYLRVTWDLKLAPKFLSHPMGQLLFYPAVTVTDAASTPILHYWCLDSVGPAAGWLRSAWTWVLALGGFALSALATLWLLLRSKGNLFEPALATTARQAEKRLRLRQGRTGTAPERGLLRSFSLPRLAVFRGLGAIVWKNLVVASRSKRELLMVGAFAFVYSGFTAALLYVFHYLYASRGIVAPPQEAISFHLGLALFLAVLTFFLQRLLPFDFRRDGQHLLVFRTLPVTALGLALAEVAVPTLFCLALQAPCLVALLVYSRFQWFLFMLVVLVYPAVALALNSVWNLHYLLAATKRTASQFASPSAVGTLLVVALSFLVFFPAGWAAVRMGNYFDPRNGIQPHLAAGLAIQYLIDGFLILLLARLFQQFEVSRDA